MSVKRRKGGVYDWEDAVEYSTPGTDSREQRRSLRPMLKEISVQRHTSKGVRLVHLRGLVVGEIKDNRKWSVYGGPSGEAKGLAACRREVAACL